MISSAENSRTARDINMRIIIVILLTAGLCLAVVAHSEDYEIRINRPVEVGAKADCSIHVILKQTLVEKGTSKPVPSIELKLDAGVEALAVDRHGLASKCAVTVQECCGLTEDGNKIDLVAKGDVLTVSGESGVIEISGTRPIDAQTKRFLDYLISISTGKDIDADQAFGTKERQKVGDTWGINATALAQGLQDLLGLALNEKDVSGAFKLTAIETMNGEQCLKVEGEYAVKNLDLAKPGTLVPAKSTLRQHMLFWIPTNPSSHIVRSIEKLDTHLFYGTADDVAEQTEVTKSFEVERSGKNYQPPIRKDPGDNSGKAPSRAPKAQDTAP